MRVAFQDASVHECAGIAFVGIADDVFLAPYGIVHELPFGAGGKAAAPTSPEAGFLDFVDDVETVHGDGLLDRRVAAGGDVVFDAFRVGAAQTRGDGTQLFCVVAGLVHDRNPLVGGCIAGNLNLCHLRDGRLGNQVTRDQLGHAFGKYPAIDNAGCAGQGDFNHRLSKTHTDATGEIYVNIKTLGRNFALDGLHNLVAARGNAAGAEPNHNPGPI